MYSPSVEARNLRFETGAAVPRCWHPAGQAVTSFFNNLSIFFPAGERFFVASVRAHRHRVTDERLAADVASFGSQEGFHSREHVRYNRMLEQQGYPAVTLERRVEGILGTVGKLLPPRMRLAATCALEHFTALMAHAILGDPRMLAGAHPVMADLWRWHAAEENEHKGVPFDVFVAAGGGYGERIATLVGATVIFWAKVVEHQVRLMATDGIAWSPREWLRLVDFLFRKPGGLRPLVRLYLDYFRRDFHPWDLDNHDLVEAWKAAQAHG